MTEELPSETAAAMAGFVLCVVGLGLVPLAVALARHLYPRREVFFARWGFSHLALVFATGVAAMYLAGALGGGSDFLTALSVNLGVFALVGAAIVRVAHLRHPDAWSSLGLQGTGQARSALTGVAVLLFLLPGIFGLTLVWPWAVERLGGTYEVQTVVLGFLELQGGGLVWAVVVAVVLQPFVEELIFRGFVQPLLAQNLGEQGGIAVTSALFAGMHGFSAFLPLFALSYALGAVMLRTRLLIGPWAMHALFNGINLALFLSVPQTREMFTS